MKRILSTVLAIAMILSTMGVTTFAAETTEAELPDVVDSESVVVEGLSGEGTSEDPYIISDIDDLKWFRDDVNAGNNYSGKVVKLADSVEALDLADEDWTPIGNGTNQFSGSFDGNNKTIKNLTINGSMDYNNGTGLNYAGLFGYLKNSGSLKNLTIENADVSGCLYVGPLAGRVYIGDEI